MNQPTQTKAVRRGPPKIARAGALVLAGLARKTKFVDPALSDNWPSIAGRDIAALCRPGRITGRQGGAGKGGRTLEVIAPNGAAATQLQMLVDDLKSRVNRFLGPNSVTHVAIKQANSGAAPAPPAQETVNTPLSAALSSFRDAVKRKNGGK